MSDSAGRRWQLPDGVEEILPPRARAIERMRRRLLDAFERWGYELVMPPLIEYLDSLLVAGGADLDLQTFKVTDQLTGRMLGVRADLTAQTARIDAHSLRREGPTRLCYASTVLRTRPEGLLGSRAPMRIGAELFGVPGPAGDAEAVALMLHMLETAGVPGVVVELGHLGLYRALSAAADLPADGERALFAAIQRKAPADIDEVLSAFGSDAGVSTLARALPQLMGDEDTLARAARLADASAPAVRDSWRAAIAELEGVGAGVRARLPGVALRYDLAELRGYHYHTGVVFSAYAENHARAVAGGGRYDDVGAAFGRARAATGFDADLGVLTDLGTFEAPAPKRITFDPDALEALPAAAALALWPEVSRLREGGACVVPAASDADAVLEWRDEAWQLAEPDRGA